MYMELVEWGLQADMGNMMQRFCHIIIPLTHIKKCEVTLQAFPYNTLAPVVWCAISKCRAWEDSVCDVCV